MNTSDWLSVGAISISAATFARTAWIDRSRSRRADVTAYFYWLPAYARVGDRRAGYHLVIQNRGPARALQVNMKAFTPHGSDALVLEGVEVGEQPEFPLEVLDAGVQYPVPWVLEDVAKEEERRYRVELTWCECDVLTKRLRHRTLMLRRGATASSV